ncbi:MAG TPA: hypothetical protein VIF14_11320 [Alphaproteobacteria bacterium]|jgi:hypothetical protein
MDRLKTPSRSRSRSFSADAERRLRSFLRGFGVEDEAALRELVRRLGRMAPAASPAQIDAAAGLWFADLLGRPDSEAGLALAAGRVAWLTTRAGKRWPLALFADAPPAPLAEALRRGVPALPPTLLADSMTAATLAPPRLFRPPAAKPLRVRPA